MKYSHSKLDIARECMLKFKFKYIDYLKMPQEDTSATDFGNVVHEVAENYKGGGKEELLALYHIAVAKVTLTDFYKAKIPLALKNIHAYWLAALATGCDKVDHELESTIEMNEEISLNGKIDLLVQKDGKYKIGDYKTSKTNKFANHTNQLAMYMLLIHKKYGIPYENMDCEVIYLSMDAETKYGEKVLNEGYENISKIYKLEESDVECLLSEIQMIHQRIKKSIDKGEWVANPTKFKCKYCEFSPICDKKYKEE